VGANSGIKHGVTSFSIEQMTEKGWLFSDVDVFNGKAAF
jgi:hypothetical protein